MCCRSLIVAVAGLFMASSSLGCGGAGIPEPPANAQPGPPPGTSPEMTTTGKDVKKR